MPRQAPAPVVPRLVPVTVAHHRSRVGNAVRWGDPAVEADARRDLRAALLEEHIKRALADAPPLTADQRTCMAQLLRLTP